MNPNQSSQSNAPANNPRLESIAYYVFLATVILAPIVFWPSPYVALDLVKTLVIAIGTLVSAILFAFVAIKERSMALPPKSIFTTVLLIIASLVISSLTSIHAVKSLFGQGFEIGTASFIALLFLFALVTFTLVTRRTEKAIILYVGFVASYLALYVFHLLRFIFGPNFASLGILNSTTTSVVGGWFNFGIISMVVALISISAIMLLPLSQKMKITYWALAVVSALGAMIVNNSAVWKVMFLAFLGITIYAYFAKNRVTEGNLIVRFVKRLSWIPVMVLIVAGIFVWKGGSIAGPVVTKMNANYTELALPWQMTLDVTAGALKNYPTFGVGPNHFSQAFLAYKPAIINTTDAWGVEFGNGFGLIPTFVATQGFVGLILWTLFFIFFGISGVRVLRKLSSEDAQTKFIAISSFFGSAFLWIIALVMVPSHATLVLTVLLTGIFFGTSTKFLPAWSYTPNMGSKSYKFMPSVLAILIVIGIIWGGYYLKKTVALAYFSAGVKQLTVSGNPDIADKMFIKALAFDSSDVYWQGRAEASLSKAKTLISSVNSSTPASTTQAVLTQVTDIINKGVGYSEKAIKYDPRNYYNYVSKARISELATAIKLDKSYDVAVSSYVQAISLNPQNPSIYLSLARLQATQQKYDDALKTLGVALQVKNNYLDAIFTLSQIYAAKNDLGNAITAAQVATQLNSNNPLLQFQLGLLQYNNKNYSAAADAMGVAVKLQPDYANARYFLGLAYARIGKTADAIDQFDELQKSNPNNEEINLILANLRAGKPIFADAVAPVTPNPEKRSNLPIKENK